MHWDRNDSMIQREKKKNPRRNVFTGYGYLCYELRGSEGECGHSRLLHMQRTVVRAMSF